MSNFALVKTGRVFDVIVATQEFIDDNFPNLHCDQAVDVTGMYVGVGFTYAGGNFTPPSPFPVSETSSILLWTSEQTWSDMLSRINEIPAADGVIVMVAPGTYTMDVAANLDRVIFIGMGAPPSESAGAVPVTINVVSPFTLLGDFLFIDCISMIVDTTIWDGGGRLQVRLEGSSFLSPLDDSSPKAISLPADGVMDVSISDLSLLAGNSSPVPFIELGQDSTINILCTGGGIVGDYTAGLASGAVSANANTTVDGSSTVSATAYDAGIATQVFTNGSPAFMAFTPAVSGDWNPIPATVQEALDQIAARLQAGSL